MLFIDNHEEVLEGAISSVILKKDGKMYTPPISKGLLNGCYRQFLIDSGKCTEKAINVNNLINADEILICNSVRKTTLVNKIFDKDGQLIYSSK